MSEKDGHEKYEMLLLSEPHDDGLPCSAHAGVDIQDDEDDLR
jgi:hypothetical protein